jgi:predicted RNA-binding Zn-ribbon protein involved in translation (DUF1610 family)
MQNTDTELARTAILDLCDSEMCIGVDEYRKIASALDPDDRPDLLRWMSEEGVDFRPALSMTALYHHAPGRQYKPSRREIDSGKFECPRCHVILIRVTLKAKDPIFRCPDCAWAINRSDVVFDPQMGEDPTLRTDVEYGQGVAPPPDEEAGPW